MDKTKELIKNLSQKYKEIDLESDKLLDRDKKLGVHDKYKLSVICYSRMKNVAGIAINTLYALERKINSEYTKTD